MHSDHSSNRNFLLSLSLFLTLLLSIIVSLFDFQELQQPKLNPKDMQIENRSFENNESVLSEERETRYLSFSPVGNQYTSGGLIALSSIDEPAVQVNGSNISGTVNINVYEANIDALLDFLMYNKEGFQIYGNPDANQFHLINQLKPSLTTDSQKILLPLAESGVWYLKAKYNDITTDAFIIRSQTGALIKEGDNEYIFWGQDMKSKRSITEGTVRLYNLRDAKRELLSANFNGEGIAKTSLTADADVAIIEIGQDRALVPVNLKYLGSQYAYRPFHVNSRSTKYFIFTDRPIYRPGDTVYFKSVIRDDDDARYTIPSGTALVKIYRGWDDKNQLFEKSFAISEYGTIDGSFQIPEFGKTGYYQIRVDVSPGKNVYNYSSASFQVDYYRKPEYFIDVSTARTELIAGDNLSFAISGSYLFGQPLANQNVKYTIYSGDYYDYEYVQDKSISLSESDDYRYGAWGNLTKISEGETILQKDGKGAVTFQAKLPQGAKKNQVFSIEAEFDDGSGNPAFSRKNVLVYAGDFSLFRTTTEYIHNVNTAFSLPVVTTANLGAKLTSTTITAKIKREQWIPVVVPDEKYPSYKLEKEDLPALTAKTDSNGHANFIFTPTKPGSYTITVSGQDKRQNTVEKAFYVWVVDNDQPTYTSASDNEITINADKKQYEPGETAKLTVASNIADRDVLLTFERGRVNRYKIIRLSGKSSIIEIPLVQTDMPNIYASISSFGVGRVDNDALNIPVSAQSKKLNVKLSTNTNKYGPGKDVVIDLLTTDKDGNPISAEAAVWAVDKAIYELVSDNKGEIFNRFWSERYNDTEWAHSLQGVTSYGAEQGGCFAADTPVLMGSGKTKNIQDVRVGETILTRTEKNSQLVKARVNGVHKQEVSGYLIINGSLHVTTNHYMWVNESWKEAAMIQIGDRLRKSDGGEVIVNSVEWVRGKFSVYNLEIKNYKTFFAQDVWVHNQKGDGARTVFKDTAYWNPHVFTDESGRAQLRFKLPDNLTTWIIVAVGSTFDTKVGQEVAEIIVAKNVVVRPIIPNIMRIGDELVVSAIVQNFTDKDQSFDVEMKFDAGEVENSTQKKISIGKNGLEQVYWKVRPKNEIEKSKITITARSIQNSLLADSVTLEIPVREFGFLEKTAMVGQGLTSLTVKLSEDSNLEKTNITLSLSSTILGTLPVAMNYLIDYPYGCTEQITSRFIPAVIAKMNPQMFPSIANKKDLQLILQKGVDELQKHQNDDGSWSWWSTGSPDPFITVYVVEYLFKAQKLGVKVDKTVLNNARQHLEQEQDRLVSQKKEESSSLDEENLIARAYALTLIESDKGKMLLNNLDSVNPDALALAVMANVKNGYTDPRANGLEKLLAAAKKQGRGLYWDPGIKLHFGSTDASTALALRALVLSGDKDNAGKAALFLARNKKFEYWSNTFATAQVLQALTDYSVVNQEANPEFSYKVLLDGKEIASGDVNNDREIPQVAITPKDIKKGGSNIQIKLNGNGQLYSTLQISEFRTNRNAKEVNKGLKVSKEIIPESGNSNLKVGDKVRVNIALGGLENQEYYVVLTDELPGGMVPINESFKNEQYGTSSENGVYWISNQEYTENGTIISLYTLKPGNHTITYRARVVSDGRFSVPPATASLMYAPEVYGRTGTQQDINISRKDTQRKIPVIIYVFGLLVVLGIIYLVFIIKQRIRNNIIKQQESSMNSE